ncbi:MAG: FG-GAP-like repeat-containing protein [Patescibacteria group bacterium]
MRMPFILILGGFLVCGICLLAQPAYAATNVTTCGVLATDGETYILQNDISSEGTCIAIAGDNIVLDLNGYTITYGTAAGTSRYGIAIPVSYANDVSRTWFPGLPDEAFGGARYATIRNGSITQGGGNGADCHAIFARSGAGSTVHSITATVHGDDTDNFLFLYANNLQIYNNTLINNSTVVSNRHQGKEVVGSLNDSGNTKIYNNTITGGPQWGIRVYEGASGSSGVEIYGNTISQNARVANPYSIAGHAPNMKIYNNTLTPQNGRGVHVTADNVEVYNNTITVKEGPNAEYAGGWSHGIKLEGATNADIHDNIVTAVAGGGYGAAYALDLTLDAGSNNEIHNNTFTATTSESAQIAAAVHFVGVEAGNGLDIHHNIFRTNNYHVYADWDSGSDVLFRTNTFERTGTPVNYHFLRFNTGTLPSTGIAFLDSILGSGVSINDVSYRTAGATIGYEIQQYLSVQVHRQAGGVLAGAYLSIRNQQGDEVAFGTTNSSGQALFAIRTHDYAGKPPVETVDTPHTIVISADGYVGGSSSISLDSSKLVIFNLATTQAGGTPTAQVAPYTAPGVSGARINRTTSPGGTTNAIVSASKSFFGFSSNLRGGYHIASGNVLGDRKAEVIAGTASGMAPQVRVFDNQGALKSQFFAYDRSLRNGVTVTACDIDGNGREEIVTAQGRGGWPLVKVFNGYGDVIHDGFFVLDGKFTGGVHVACGDTNGDGISEIVVAAMRGGGPQVMVYSAAGKILTNFMAYDPGFRGGINVTTADADGDGKDEIITGPQWGAPHVQIFQIRPNQLKRLSPGFFAFHRDYRGGVSVAGVDTDGDGTKEIVVGVGDNATPFVKVYDIRERWRNEFYVYAQNFLGGVQLSGGDVDGDGTDELLTIPRAGGAPHIRIIKP